MGLYLSQGYQIVHSVGERLNEFDSLDLRYMICYHSQYKQNHWGIKPNSDPEVDTDRLDGMISAYVQTLYI